MVFSSVIFLFLFLPLVLAFYYLAGQRMRNAVLLLCSLFFYAWGETVFVFLMLFSIFINYLVGLGIDASIRRKQSAKFILGLGIALNLLPLAYFKYGNFVAENVSPVLLSIGVGGIDLEPIHLPIGISFFTFQAMSYLIDIYRREAEIQHSPVNLALYISLFPQLIAGPIVRYHDIAQQLASRVTTLEDFSYGCQRFIIGLGKKVLIANVMGKVADHIFGLPTEVLPAHLAWLGILAFTLQIYFDFSGYSDMAIGLARMFGFRLLENFNYPYISRSIREFWRRWHISLSSWFRDYLFFPLGGSRVSVPRTYFNLVLVFLLCGLWHGASWNFVVWGLYHGFFLVVERTAFGRLLDRLPSLIQHIYALLVIMVGWVFFRADSLGHALDYLAAMVNFNAPPYFDVYLLTDLNAEFYLVLFVGLVASTPISQWIKTHYDSLSVRSGAETAVLSTGWVVLQMGILLYASAILMNGDRNPFLYFRF